ncbi:unnamed protein product [Echinostoma caproni]|uniref:Cyclin N-terminal domain-containing protein n=1 Tax=Echinostoma caproni TaxID=27848 RepID=A0A183A2G4_9TREM|nr:unnamed protein product [Echinostoma caproni]
MEDLGPSVKSFLVRSGIPHHAILSQLDQAVAHFRLTSYTLHLDRIQRAIAALALLRIMASSDSLLEALLDEAHLKSLLDPVYEVPVDQFIQIVVQPFLQTNEPQSHRAS